MVSTVRLVAEEKGVDICESFAYEEVGTTYWGHGGSVYRHCVHFGQVIYILSRVVQASGGRSETQLWFPQQTPIGRFRHTTACHTVTHLAVTVTLLAGALPCVTILQL